MSLMDLAQAGAAQEAGGLMQGVAVAIVTNNRDDEGQCRVKVRYPWHSQPRDSYWARLATPMAGDGRGLVLIPEVGDEVLVAFERGDLHFPYVLGALWNGQDKPPAANDDGRNDRRLLRTRKGHQLLFDDNAGRGVVELAHEKGRVVTLDDDGITVQDGQGNQLRIDSNSGAMTLQASGTLHIKATSITIEASASLEIKAGATLSVRGTLVNIN